MKKLLALALAALLLCTLALASCGEAKSYTIGIVQQMPHVALDSATQGFKDALVEEFGEGNLTFLEQNAQGDPTTCTTIVNDFTTKNVDLIMANATTALQAAANGTATIPVLGTSVTEYGVALDIDDFDGLVGGNVSGTSDLAPLDEQAAMILELYPDTKKVGLLYCSAEPNSVYQVKVVRQWLEAKNIACTEFSFADGNDLASVAKAAAAASDVIYVPTDNTIASYAETVNGAVLPTKTPIIGGDPGICGSCGVATIGISYYDLGYTTGKMAVEVLKGKKKIEEMPIQYSATFQKVYNPVNCKELGVDTAKLEGMGYTAIESN